jgi:ribonucleases P/MRP protein subunit RPP40
MLGLVSRTLDFKSAENIIPLYKSLVRPLIEFGSAFWNPYQQKDIDIIERVQRRATKMVPRARNLNYENRLKLLGLDTLESRRVKIDMIQLYKILNGIDRVEISEIFDVTPTNTRTNGFKISLKPGRRFKTDMLKYSFFNRVVGAWNSLDDYVVASASVESFKRNYEKFVNNGGNVFSYYSR